MTDKELMQQALIKAARFVIKALDEESAAYGPKDRIAHVDEAAAMLRAAVAQPDVPEVGFGNMPKKAAWVGLTDDEVEKIVDDNTQEHKMIEYTVQVDSHYTKWYLNEKLHREDGPAVELTNGNKVWYLNGQWHREDGPAVELTNGNKWWYFNGQRHRTDGAAFESINGDREWYLNGYEVTEAAVMKPVKQLTVAAIEALLGHRIEVIAG